MSEGYEVKEKIFDLRKLNWSDKRFMSRSDVDKWEEQVEIIEKQIDKDGVRNMPGIARLRGESEWIAVYGFTRIQACLNLEKFEVKVRKHIGISARAASRLNLVDNTTRFDLEPMDLAEKLYELKNKYGFPITSKDPTKPSLCSIANMSRRNVHRWLNIVEDASDAIKQGLRDGLPASHAEEMIKHEVNDQSLIEQDLENDWSKERLNVEIRRDQDTEENVDMRSNTNQTSDDVELYGEIKNILESHGVHLKKKAAIKYVLEFDVSNESKSRALSEVISMLRNRK